MLLSKTIDFFIDSLYAARKSEQTIDNYKFNLKLFLKYTGDLRLYEVQNTHIRAFQKSRSHLKAWTVHQSYRVIRRFFNWCVIEGFLESAPMQNVEAPSLGKRVISVYTHEEIQKLLSVCNEKRFIGARNKAMISVLVDTGIREGELVGLDMSKVAFHSGIMKVIGKGDKERVVKVGDKTRKALMKYLFLREDQILNVENPKHNNKVFLSEEGRPLTEKGALTIISRLGRVAGIPHVYIHKFRHTCAVEFLRAGGDLRTLQIMLGHEDIATTSVYLTAMNADDVIRSHLKFSPGDRFL